jgi:GNAT superfamily N-acetyltransferase
MKLSYLTVCGHKIATVFDDLAQLRITVFKDFPYLYQGSIDYEKEYLKTYTLAERSMLFAVYSDGRMVGATTCIPLIDETAEVQAPFQQAKFDLATVFYFGESILIPEFRGQGLGNRFFDVRENHAHSFGSFKTTCFCSVVRPEDHPQKPVNYRPLDDFWIKRGYKKEPTLQSQFNWLDIGDSFSTRKQMVYWMRSF